MQELTLATTCPRCSQNPRKSIDDLTPMTHFIGEDGKQHSVCSECAGVFSVPEGFVLEERDYVS